MNPFDQARLAKIRADNEKWIAIEPSAKGWDTSFLLILLDEALKKEKVR